MRALLVLNEKSRRGRRDGRLVRQTLEDLGIDCEPSADTAGVEAVVAAGGDGTVVSALPLAIARNVPLGIVPLGTFNDLAHALGVPLGAAAACRVILDGVTRNIDVGSVNGAYFASEASIGISARIARRQTPEVKQRFGIFGVLATTMQSLRAARPFGVDLRYGDRREKFQSIQLTIANGPRFGGIIERSDAAIDDGWLDLYSVEPANLLQALRVAVKIVARDPRSEEGLRTRRATEFAVHTKHAHRIAADGEPAGVTPAVFRILPKAVRVIVPKLAGCNTELSATPASSSRLSDSAPG